jgi:hypothetical protein
MDSFFEAIGKLLGVFKEPTQVVLLLVALAEGFGIYKLARFIFDQIEKDRERDLNLAKAMEGLTAIIKEKMNGK